MKIAISGSTGLIGSCVSDWLTKCGHTVLRLVRPDSKADGIRWDIAGQSIDLQSLEGLDAVIHFAGANIAGHRWTPRYKDEILQSRVQGTSLLAQSLTKLKQKPKLFLSASAIGYYGDVAFSDAVDEDSPSGKGFLADVTGQWEAAAQPALAAGINTAYLRMGVVLDKKGGALAQMLPPFYWGLGGPIGSGRQGLSWVALAEIPLIIEFLLQRGDVRGPINLTSPNAVMNAEFTKTLAQVIRRPAVLPLPDFVVKMLFGQMGEELLLSGSHVKPKRLSEMGYRFAYPDLSFALRTILRS